MKIMINEEQPMSMEDLVNVLRRLTRDELRELVRRVPKFREAAEARVAYQVVQEPEVASIPTSAEGLTPEQRRSLGRDELAARYKNPVQWTEHPWVVRVEGYQGGEPIILGTRIPVRVIAIAWIRHGMPIWDVLDNWDVHEAQVYDALSYYYDHREELDEIIREQEDVERWMREYPPGKYEGRIRGRATESVS